MNKEVLLRTADEAELDALLELWTTVFMAEPGVFTCEILACPPELRKTFIAEVGGKIVSSVQLFGVPVRDEWKGQVMVGAIANVATLPEFRKGGFATRLLRAATEEMKAKGYGWSFLLTGKHSFYERLGWRTIHRSYLRLRLEASVLTEVATPVKLHSNPDLLHLHALSDSSFVTPLSQIRSDLDWEFRIPERIRTKAVFMSDIAYAIVREKGQDAVLEEWGMAQPSIEQFQNLLLAVARWAIAKDMENLIVSAPILSEARQALETLFSDVKNVEESEGMVRPLSPEWPMSRLISFFALPEARFFRMDNF